MADDPLALASRRRLYEVVERTPGLSAREIQRQAGTAWGETSYHLERLETAGLVQRERGPHQDFYFGARVPLGDRTLLRLARSEAVRRILVELLRSEEELPLVEIAERSSLSVSRTSIHLRRLLETGILVASRQGPLRTFRVGESNRIARVLVTYREGYADRWIDQLVDTWSELFSP
ncbi:MAG TPA: winged helix-turn-helix transcriptional regulator [Thermoplasmata archaeon]|nr:winged helix-turn-helix transcriptional regulator [Thermoplasmata archaeon]